MYQIARRLTLRKQSSLFIRDHDGRVIGNSRETIQVITDFFLLNFINLISVTSLSEDTA